MDPLTMRTLGPHPLGLVSHPPAHAEAGLAQPVRLQCLLTLPCEEASHHEEDLVEAGMRGALASEEEVSGGEGEVYKWNDQKRSGFEEQCLLTVLFLFVLPSRTTALCTILALLCYYYYSESCSSRRLAPGPAGSPLARWRATSMSEFVSVY